MIDLVLPAHSGAQFAAPPCPHTAGPQAAHRDPLRCVSRPPLHLGTVTTWRVGLGDWCRYTDTHRRSTSRAATVRFWRQAGMYRDHRAGPVPCDRVATLPRHGPKGLDVMTAIRRSEKSPDPAPETQRKPNRLLHGRPQVRVLPGAPGDEGPRGQRASRRDLSRSDPLKD